MRILFVSVAILSVLAGAPGCKTTGSIGAGSIPKERRVAVDASPAASLAALMEGRFRTAPDDPENDFVDSRLRIAPMGAGVWLYYQLNTGPDRRVYRQRVLHLQDRDDGAVVQVAYDLADPSRFQLEPGAKVLSSAFADISVKDLNQSLPDGCEQVWRPAADEGDALWVGRVDRLTCKVFSPRRQADIALFAEARLGEDILRQTEKGYSEDGALLFGGPDGTFITLYRIAD